MSQLVAGFQQSKDLHKNYTQHLLHNQYLLNEEPE